MKELYKKWMFELVAVYLVLITFLIGFYYTKPSLTSFVATGDQLNFKDNPNLVLSESGDYTWILGNPGLLKSVKVSGTLENRGSAKAYIENNGIKHLIFDSNKLNEKDALDKVTGFMAAEVKNQDKNQNKPAAWSLNIDSLSGKNLGIDLEYKAGTNYDVDDNGIETTKGIIDFTVENTRFNREVDKRNLCTRWRTYSIENKESATVCYGSDKCCNFVGLFSTEENWDEPFYSVYGRYGTTLNNLISAQIVYADYDFSLEQSYTDIKFSEWADLSAAYYTALAKFEDVCLETCALFDFGENSYRLIFEIDNTTLKIDAIGYTLENKIGI